MFFEIDNFLPNLHLKQKIAHETRAVDQMKSLLDGEFGTDLVVSSPIECF